MARARDVVSTERSNVAATPSRGVGRIVKKVRAFCRSPRVGLYRLAVRLGGGERALRIVTAFPSTFSDKVRFKMAHDRRPLLADFADKLRSKDYVARTVGPEYAPEVLAVFDDADSIRTEGLPSEFVMKVSHASRGMVFSRWDADPGRRVPAAPRPFERVDVRPDAFDVERVRGLFAHWLETPFRARQGEWAYGVHRPCVLVEPFLRPTSGGTPRDVKCHVVNGRLAFMVVLEERTDGRASNRYFRDGTEAATARYLPYHGASDIYTDRSVGRPAAFAEMIDVAERLAAPVDYVRVDLLDFGDRFLVGELTNYPSGGNGRFTPRSFERWLGRRWTLPSPAELRPRDGRR